MYKAMEERICSCKQSDVTWPTDVMSAIVQGGRPFMYELMLLNNMCDMLIVLFL